jgi:hypothetical protein
MTLHPTAHQEGGVIDGVDIVRIASPKTNRFGGLILGDRASTPLGIRCAIMRGLGKWAFNTRYDTSREST